MVKMPGFQKRHTGIERSRRNLIKAGVIGASAIFGVLTKTGPSAADGGGCGDGGGDDALALFGRRRCCFLKGATIRTANGDRKVEDLSVGDLLPTVFGGVCPIQWIGRYPFRKSDPKKGWVKDVLPVRIARSALGPDMPHADLCVTKVHALLIDGVLVPAGDLVNGTTITLYDARELDELEFFHIKLERHNVIYAEGAPCETLLNVDENAVNFAEYLRRYGHARIDEAPCAPLLSFNGGRNELKSRFRSALSPWIDRRQTLDIIRDEIEERGIALLRQPELMS
jgi:Hint domain